MPKITITDIPNNGSVRLTSDNYEHGLCIIRDGLNINAFINHCPHMGMPMDWAEGQFLTADKQYIQCAVHGALFNKSDGVCVAGPCQGQRLQPVPFTVKDGQAILD